MCNTVYMKALLSRDVCPGSVCFFGPNWSDIPVPVSILSCPLPVPLLSTIQFGKKNINQYWRYPKCVAQVQPHWGTETGCTLAKAQEKHKAPTWHGFPEMGALVICWVSNFIPAQFQETGTEKSLRAYDATFILKKGNSCCRTGNTELLVLAAGLQNDSEAPHRQPPARRSTEDAGLWARVSDVGDTTKHICEPNVPGQEHPRSDGAAEEVQEMEKKYIYKAWFIFMSAWDLPVLPISRRRQRSSPPVWGWSKAW